ncbi:MAG TPA: hypothetical protein PK636_04560, partial [bacterium]|nr:hypothetical protein [bacterium]
SVGIGLDGPLITDHCGVEPYTVSLSKNGYVAYDLLVVFDLDPDDNGTDNYYYLPGSTFFAGTFAENGGGTISSFEPDTATPGELRWDFATQGGGSGDLSQVGSIRVDLRLPCTAAVYTYSGRAEYNDRCDDGTIPRESTVSAGPDQPLWVREGDISIIKMPEAYYATEDTAEWFLTVVNGGDGGAYNLHVIDTLSSDLSFAGGVPWPEDVAGQTITWNFQSLTATWGGLTDLDGDGYFDDLAAGETVNLSIAAAIEDCTDLHNEVYSTWGCLTTPCQTSNWATSTVYLPPPGLLGVTTFPVAVDLCDSAPVIFEVRNSGQTHIYEITAAEKFPSGADYVPGSSEYSYNAGGGWGAYTAIPDPDYWPAQTYPYQWTAQTHIPEFQDLTLGARVRIRFDVEADCDFPAGDRIFRSRASYENPCGEYKVTSETAATMNLNNMDVQIVKEGRNETRDPGGPLSTDPVIADAGDTVYWRVTLSNAGSTDAQYVTMTDTLPDTVTFSSAAPAPDYQSGQTVAWFVGTDLPFVATVEATVDGDGCQALSYNSVDVAWGCGDLGCTAGTKHQVHALTTEVDLQLPGWNQLTAFTTCNGTVAFSVTNDGATAEELDFVYTVPDGYVYDASGGGAEISSSDPAHTFTEPEEEPVDLGGNPQQLRFAGAAQGGNIIDGNDYAGPAETLTVAFNVYRVPSDFSCDTDPHGDPPVPGPVAGWPVGSYSNSCGVYVTDGVDFTVETVTP